MKTKALVVLSGGQDSVTCLGVALKNFDEVEAISFYYNQKHDCELICAEAVCAKYDVPHKIIEVDFLDGIVNTNLTRGNGSVNDRHPDNSDLPASFVPNRNALFLTLSHAFAQKIKADTVITGVCQTDYSGYPDCRQSFIDLLNLSLNMGSETEIRITAPLMFLTKAQTFELAEKVGFLKEVIYNSHTCYNGVRDKMFEWGYGCGDCPACVVRRNGWEVFRNTLQKPKVDNSDFVTATIRLKAGADAFISSTPVISAEDIINFVEDNKDLIGEI